MGLVFTFVEKAAEPTKDPRLKKKIEEEPAQELDGKEVPDRVYLRAVMDRIMEMPEAFAAAVETMRAIRERFLLDRSLPEFT